MATYEVFVYLEPPLDNARVEVHHTSYGMDDYAGHGYSDMGLVSFGFDGQTGFPPGATFQIVFIAQEIGGVKYLESRSVNFIHNKDRTINLTVSEETPDDDGNEPVIPVKAISGVLPMVAGFVLLREDLLSFLKKLFRK